MVNVHYRRGWILESVRQYLKRGYLEDEAITRSLADWKKYLEDREEQERDGLTDRVDRALKEADQV